MYMNNDPFSSLGIVVDLTQPCPVSIAEEDERQEEEEHLRNKAERKAFHISNCGSFYRHPDPHNGRKLVPFRVKCKYWRECPTCLEDRAQKFRTRYYRCIEDVGGREFLGIAQMSERECKELTKRMKKTGTKYRRNPTEEGVILLFDKFHFPELDNPELHDSLNWHDICQTPRGKRPSGKLGAREEEEKEGIVVAIPQVNVEGLEDWDIDHAWSTTLANTDELDPAYDVEEIEEALEIRMDEFSNVLVAMGGEIVDEYRIRGRVKEEKFGWKTEWNKDQGFIDTNRTLPPPGFVEETDPLAAWKAKLDADRAIEELFDY